MLILIEINGLQQKLLKLVDIVHRIDQMPSLLFTSIKSTKVLIPAIQVEPTQGFAVVVIQQDTKIRLHYPYGQCD